MSVPGYVHPDDTARLASSLIEKWAWLEPMSVSGLRGVPPPSLSLTKEEMKRVSAWANAFKDQIEAIRRTRNYVVHLNPAAVPISDLVDANEFADRLLEVLVVRVPRLADVLGIQVPERPWWDIPSGSGDSGLPA